jgi:peptide/nickel transport system substrate-binding protein
MMNTLERHRWLFVAAFAVGSLSLVACQLENNSEVVQPAPSASTEAERAVLEVTRLVVEERIVEVAPQSEAATTAPKQLAICIPQEPESLYWYGSQSAASRAVYQALYEANITHLNYGYQAQGLVKLPSLADGDAVVETVSVAPGELVVDVRDDVVAWGEGVSVRTADGQILRYAGEGVELHQLAATFTLKPRVWSDGEPVTAADSVFSFSLAADEATPESKYRIERTAVYDASGPLSVVWRGVPGYMAREYFLHFWQPLPAHRWGQRSAVELLMAQDSAREPVGDGPFKLAAWVPGETIQLVRNEQYYRAGEGLPYLDAVTFKFVGDVNQLVTQLLTGQCDVATTDTITMDQAPVLLDAERNGALQAHFQTGTVFEHIDFNTDPLDRRERGGNRTVWFADVRVRQAVTMCTDRQAMIDQILYGRSQIMHGYVPAAHPLYAADAVTWQYDPVAANALLDAAGYLDTDADGVRNHPETGETFAVTIGTRDGFSLIEQVAQLFAEQMRRCGIEVAPYALPAEEWFALGEGAPLFGRRFDLAAFAWPTGDEPLCDLFLTAEIPGPPSETDEEGNALWPAGWGGANETGWSNVDFDAACAAALNALPGTSTYVSAHQEAQRIFSESLPIIPLFLRLKVAATRTGVLNFRLDPTASSDLYNLYEIDLQE